MKPNQALLMFFACLFVSISLPAQTCSSCGLDDNPWLTDQEAIYLNSILHSKRGDFDFRNKKLAFLTNNSLVYRIDKSDFFQELNESEPAYQDGSDLGFELLLLNSQEKKIAEGFHAILVVWCSDCSSSEILETWMQMQQE